MIGVLITLSNPILHWQNIYRYL